MAEEERLKSETVSVAISCVVLIIKTVMHHLHTSWMRCYFVLLVFNVCHILKFWCHGSIC